LRRFLKTQAHCVYLEADMTDGDPVTKNDERTATGRPTMSKPEGELEYPATFDDPVDAIRFYMAEKGFTQKDLVPMIGSRSKVSEVLSGSRGITMAMARALHRHLEIPAEDLLKEPKVLIPDRSDEIDWRRFPLRQMANRGWIEPEGSLRDDAEELLTSLMERAGGSQYVTALYHKNDQKRANAKTDPYALNAWCWQVLAQANARRWPFPYRRPNDPLDLMRQVARLSPAPDGPRRAVTFLRERGIAVEIVPHLPRTHLDGAAMMSSDGRPVIGLTLRYDRIDNFWWVLMHELAHATAHLDDNPAFIDDLKLESTGAKEKEADQLAQDALIPRDVWQASGLAKRPSTMAVISLAQELNVHPAIVAGRARHELSDFRKLSKFVGSREVNHLFDV
jgi:HTH-type transcriptional regulator/antitoxin HigA